jgi:CubicO group peptidase (beta-lactamase class C family)
MFGMSWLLRFILCCVCGCAPLIAAAAEAEFATRVDRLFAAWDHADTPGAVLAVLRDGKPVLSRGYGMANLEYGVPNTTATVFHVASLSKQFTACAIHLLALDGKLSLDDEVRKYVPELQLHGPPITIRHMLHHTSGLRDQWSLLTLAGLRLDDVITEADILGLLGQQRALNFTPGDEELYSNSGYTLLALIVKRISGQSLDAFAQQRIFKPLGMTSTHFQDSYGALVKGRAYSYERTRGGWRYVALSYSNVGATSLMTTVEDLMRWNANFDDPRVGGAPLLAAMLRVGHLNSGRATSYASGLVVRPYRGLPSVEHGGADAGYRSHLLRIPQQRLAVLLLGNAGDLNVSDLAHRVADIYLESMDGKPGLEAARIAAVEVELSARTLAPYLGDFEMHPGFVLSFTAEGNRLMVQATGQAKFPMFASAGDRFFMKVVPASVHFDAPAGEGMSQSATWQQGGREQPLRRIVRQMPTAAALQVCEGEYYSEELRVLYRLALRDGKLILRYPRGELELRPVSGDDFSVNFPIGNVTLRRGVAGACDGLAVTTGRVRNLEFRRVRFVPAS